MPVNMNEDLSATIKEQIEDMLVGKVFTVILNKTALGYDIRLGDGRAWAETSVPTHAPVSHGWAERLTKVVRELISTFAIERYLRK